MTNIPKYLLFLFLLSCSNGLENEKSVTTKETSSIFVLNDTTFLHRAITSDYYHAIYIDTNKQSKHYTLLTNFEFSDDEMAVYQESYNDIKSKLPSSYQKINEIEIPKYWLPLYQYQDKYYLYSPSDRGTIGKRILNDSSFIYWYMDGPMPLPLLDVEKQSDRKYKFKMATHDKETYKVQELTIHVIDPKTGLSIFEYSNENKASSEYQLYIPVESIKYFDIVVNHCDNQKQLEFVFDTIDYNKLVAIE